MLTVVMTMVSNNPDDKGVWKEAWEYGTSWNEEQEQAITRLIQEAEERGEKRGELRGRIIEVQRVLDSGEYDTSDMEYLDKLQAQLQETK